MSLSAKSQKMKLLSLFTITILLVISVVSGASAQTVKGKWYGVGNVVLQDGGSANNYMCELILEQKGNVVTGEFNYFFRNGYFSNKIKGTYTPDKRLLKIKMIPILFYKTINTAIGVDCPMEGEFTLKVSRVETALQGGFKSDESHAYTCAPINVRFVKQLKEVPFKEFVEEEISKGDTLSRIVEAPQPVIVPVQVSLANMRRKELVKTLEVSEDSVRIDLYDNGEYDHDSITVLYNNQVIVSKQELQTRKPISFYVKVDSISSNNDLLMYAENLGDIPPNSALMIITDKEHRYEVNLTSNYQKNAAVRLRKKGTPEELK